MRQVILFPWQRISSLPFSPCTIPPRRALAASNKSSSRRQRLGRRRVRLLRRRHRASTTTTTSRSGTKARVSALQLVDIQLGGAAAILFGVADTGGRAVRVRQVCGAIDHAGAVAEALVPVLDAHPIVALGEAQGRAGLDGQGRRLGREAVLAARAAERPRGPGLRVAAVVAVLHARLVGDVDQVRVARLHVQRVVVHGDGVGPAAGLLSIARARHVAFCAL